MKNLLTIKTLKDNSIVRSFLNYPKDDEALSALYYTMSSAIVDDNVKKVVCAMLGDDGIAYKLEDFDKTIQE